ncbi:MAG: RHS repeat protein [Actinobacteria bacterium]|nr:MAG: RHS repeat protein [Actinomycetota bacterium]
MTSCPTQRPGFVTEFRPRGAPTGLPPYRGVSVRRSEGAMYPRQGTVAVAGLVAGLLAGALLGGVPALARPSTPPPAPDPGPAVSAVKRIPSHFTKAANQPASAYAPKATTLPSAGIASLHLSAASAAPVKATGTPVWARPVVEARGRYSGPPGLDVAVLDQASAVTAGVKGVLFTVTPIGSGTGPVRVGLDYSAFAQAFGGNFGSNDTTAKTVSAQINPGVVAPRAASASPMTTATPMVLAATSDPGQEGGSAGSYAATSLSPLGSWTAGGSTGGFNYTYPILIPPAASPLMPRTAMVYDSSDVDGKTASTQAQSSWAGDGWSTPSSYVEQSFVACSDSPEGSASPVATSDQCYNGPVLTLSLNGSSTSLVWDSGRSMWKPQSDSGEVVTHVTNSGNGSGTYNTDYWTVTERSGTVYQFGRNELPGWVSGKATTNSVDSEPVYSAHPGDPCYNTAGFTSSVCTMAYRWNLDYVKDIHGNAMAYYYRQDANYYAQNKGAKMSSYVRDSHLDHVDYGLPDVPFDLICAAGSTCSAQGPSFFSTVRLASISAQQYSVASSSYLTVDSYALSQSFPATGDGTSPTLWLDSVTRTGSGTTGGGSTTPVTLPAVTFGKVQLQNRVDSVTDGLPPFYRYRIASIATETGSVISPTYTLVNPCTAPVTITPSANTSSCYPVSWTPPGYTAPFTDWFNKYVVSKVTATDPTGGAPATATSYVYRDHGAAWHYDDNEVVQAKYRTYGQFRGYSDVITLTGDGANDPQAKSETVYYQGMSRDNNSTVANLTDSAGGVHEDLDQLSGRALETTTYLGNGGPVDHSTITSYWVSGPTATRNRNGLPALTANWVAPAETYSRQALTDGGAITWRYSETDTTYDATVTDVNLGLVLNTYSHTVPADTAYDRCTTTTYAAANPAANLVGLPGEVETDSVACGGFTEGTPASVPAGSNRLTAPATVNRPGQVVTDARTFYDDPTFATTYPQPSAPSKGDVTMVRKASDWSGGGFTYQTTARSTYDGIGRVTASYDGDGNRTGTAYTMNAVGLTTATAVTNALNQTTTTTVDPQRGTTLTATDPNSVVTTHQYDALGRVTSVWLNSRSTSVAANYTYSYQVSNTGTTSVTTNRLTDASAYRSTITIYDGQLRVRQTQATTPVSTTSRLVTDTFYDSRGWVRAKYTNWYDANNLPSTTLVAASGAIPMQDFYTYDGLGRVVVDTSEDSGVAKSTTTTVYNGDRTTTVPPAGGVTRAVLTDPLGRMTELDEYTTAPTVSTPANTFTGTWSVSGGTTTATRYGYDGHGKQNTVTDAQNSTWTSTYNLLGEVTAKADPDAGTSALVYDGNGNLVQSTDSRGRTTSTTYDPLNRKTATYAAPTGGQSSANQMTSWVYDNGNAVAGVTNAVGHLTTQTAYWGGAAYTTQYRAFNVFGESLGETVTIPSATEGTALGISYAFSHVYTATNGLLLKDIYPAAGGLPSETVLHSYTSDDLPNGTGMYAQQTAYDAWGRVSQETIGASPNEATITNLYDAHTGRLTEQLTTNQILTTPTRVDDESYVLHV